MQATFTVSDVMVPIDVVIANLEKVSSIHSTFRFTETEEIVDFINEEDNVAFRLCHIFQYTF